MERSWNQLEMAIKLDGKAAESAGNGAEALTVEILAKKAVDNGISGAVAVAEELEDGEDSASDGATMRTSIPQQIDLHTTRHYSDIYVRRN